MAAGVILAAAFSRVLPHPYNFTPIGALGIFGGTTIKDKKYALIFPLGALLLSDIMLQLFTRTPGFYGWEQSFVYGAIILTTYLATRIKTVNVVNVGLACIWTSAIFFLLSNFGTWVAHYYYPHTFAGLMQCYAAAIPFYQGDPASSFALNLVLGNIFYTAVMFGIYTIVKSKLPNVATQRA